eukprot:15404892-Alexandrium_andersonii.AAC.1
MSASLVGSEMCIRDRLSLLAARRLHVHVVASTMPRVRATRLVCPSLGYAWQLCTSHPACLTVITR